MGSGDKFTYGYAASFGFGFSMSKFPFAVTLMIQFLVWYISIGFGKAYDEP